MRFTIFLSNFAATLFLVETCEAVYSLSDSFDAKSMAAAASMGDALAANNNYDAQKGDTNWDTAYKKADTSAQDILFDMDGTTEEKLAKGTVEMKKAMLQIPYLK